MGGRIGLTPPSPCDRKVLTWAKLNIPGSRSNSLLLHDIGLEWLQEKSNREKRFHDRDRNRNALITFARCLSAKQRLRRN